MATAKEETAQVNRDLNTKLKLERTFRPEVRSIFGRMVKAFAVSVARTGTSPQAETYRSEWEGAVRKHFVRTQGAFLGTVSSLNGKSLDKILIKQDEEDDEDALLFGLLTWANMNAPKDADHITATNQKNFDRSIDEARAILQQEEEPFGNRDLALTAAAILKRKFNGRVESITSFETQSSAEATKLTEAEVSAGLEPSVLAPSGFVIVTATKVWRTIGDKLVRVTPFNHMAADRQVKKITQPFEVSGQLLMNPADTSLGASAGNVINCRCSAIYRI